MKNKIKYSSVLLSVLLASMAFVGCNNEESKLSENMSSVTTEIYTSDVSSDTSSQDFISSEVSSETMQSEIVTSVPSSSAVSSNKEESVSSKASPSSKQPVSSQPPKPVSSQPVKEPASSESPNFGERMDEAEVDRIIAEGIEYANSKGMAWKDDYTIEGNGYYNPPFSGHGEEAFRRDLFYNIDQIYHLNVDDPDYDAELYNGCTGYYKIVKGEFEEPGYWYGFVLY